MAEATVYVPSPHRRLSLIHIEDVSRAVVAAVSKLSAQSQDASYFDTVHLCGGPASCTSVGGLLRLVYNVTGSRSPLVLSSPIHPATSDSVVSFGPNAVESKLSISLIYPSLYKGILHYIYRLEYRDLSIITQKYNTHCGDTTPNIRLLDGCEVGFTGSTFFDSFSRRSFLECIQVSEGGRSRWYLQSVGLTHKNMTSKAGITMELLKGTLRWRGVRYPLFRLSCGQKPHIGYLVVDEKKNKLSSTPNSQHASLIQLLYHAPTQLHAVVIHPPHIVSKSTPQKFQPRRLTGLGLALPFKRVMSERFNLTDQIELFSISPFRCSPDAKGNARLPLLEHERYWELLREMNSPDYDNSNPFGFPPEILSKQEPPPCKKLSHAMLFYSDRLNQLRASHSKPSHASKIGTDRLIGSNAVLDDAIVNRERYWQLLRELKSYDYTDANPEKFPPEILSKQEPPPCKKLSHAKTFHSDRLTQLSKEIKTETVVASKFRSNAVLDDAIVNRPVGDVHNWDWARTVPVCDNHCGLVGGCIRTGKCRCVQPHCSDRTAEERRRSTIGYVFSDSKEVSIDRTRLLSEQVESLPREEAYHPHVVPFTGTSWAPPRVHVTPPSTSDLEAMEYLRNNEHNFKADLYTFQVLQSISVPAGTAELIVPHYFHGLFFDKIYDIMTKWGENLKNSTLLIDRVIKETNSKAQVVWMLTHDYGGCLHFKWHHRALRNQNEQIPILKKSFILEAMGDYNTNCYLPHKDTVIAPCSPLNQDLMNKFHNLDSVLRIQDRPYFLFFKGRSWGTGKLLRVRAVSRSLYPHVNASTLRTDLNTSEVIDMSLTLGKSQFCLHIPGVAGWSFRLSDIIYSGCIPVLISGFTHYPYQDIIDYKKFSVVVQMEHLDRIEDILRAVPIEERIQKQLWALKIRDAFVYDSKIPKGVENLHSQRGPVFFDLLSLRLKLSSSYSLLAS
eukprot:CAMPEP_0182439848 /NCGR_PEP_ID=MMETSP1167-20130531/86691_1 /TAXON_ID=2988 /ORGANISM="Mallomonas Sp, Strain CCMP3275" /LENGTH=952 /DNA_ID=CAMNT_0024633647 /DNA_START=466 /DNA_END=3324 /DNA_ORIENTATION=-